MTDERMPVPGDAQKPQVPSAGAPQPGPAVAGGAATEKVAAAGAAEAGKVEREETSVPSDVASAPAEPAAAAPTEIPAEPAEASEPAEAASAPADGAAPVPAEGTAAAPRPGSPTVSSVSPDIDLAQDASPLPGAHRGGFLRLPTAPVPLTVETAPHEPGGEFTPDDTQWASTESGPYRGLAGWALAFAIAGLVVSMFVGWGFPIGLVAVVSAIIALRRPLENRAMAVWAIVLGTMSMLYSAGWLLYAAMLANLFG